MYKYFEGMSKATQMDNPHITKQQNPGKNNKRHYSLKWNLKPGHMIKNNRSLNIKNNFKISASCL